MRSSTVAEKNQEKKMSEIAKEVGVDPSYVSLVLRKRRMPSLPVAGRIARAMGISLDELHDRLVEAA